MRETKDFLKLCRDRINYEGFISFLDTELNDNNARSVSNVLKHGKPSPIFFNAVQRNLNRLKFRKRLLQDACLLMIKNDPQNQSKYEIQKTNEDKFSFVKDLEKKTLNECCIEIISFHIAKNEPYRYFDHFLASCNPEILQHLLENVDPRQIGKSISKVKDNKILKVFHDYITQKISNSSNHDFNELIMIAYCINEFDETSFQQKMDEILPFYQKLMNELNIYQYLSSFHVKVILNVFYFFINILKVQYPFATKN
jgi:hypothetical protein